MALRLTLIFASSKALLADIKVHSQNIQHSRGCGFTKSHWLQEHILDRLSLQT
ncbi:uncharacterized protein FTOL_13430 [Fusarium torulosum]|uniref:Uncharacterized protein n=1 Tax=Fusarium torulosum TaxID=33205 RepID=A0AAE8MNT6_9HYPO|nr:uncharacterized protein FTOL_13430 [Fusarium torulosum]